MSNGQPFNLLKSWPRRLSIPVSVSSAGQFVWANEDPKERPALKGLGWFGDGPQVGAVPTWRNPPLTDAQWAGMVQALNGRDLWEWEEGPKYRFCNLKTYLRRKCDRLMLAQNCVLVEENGSTYLETDHWQWFAPPRSGLSTVSADEASVRPWTGPAGDIAGWTGPRYGDFAPLAVMRFASGHPRNQAANELLGNADTFADLPEAWNIANPPAPIYRVDYDQPFERDSHGHKVYIQERSEAAMEFVENHAPDRIVYWANDPNAEDSSEVENHRVNAFDLDNPLPLWLRGNMIRPGDAFDLMLLVTTWKFCVRVRDDGVSAWEIDEEGRLEVRTAPGGVATQWHDFAAGDSMDDVFEWRVNTQHDYAECRAHVRQTHAMPPRQEGGAEP